jgi:hypothetical protein
MNPKKLRDRRRLRQQMAIYHENVRQHQEQMQRHAEALLEQERITAETNLAIAAMIAQVNAPIHALLHELETGIKR